MAGNKFFSPVPLCVYFLLHPSPLNMKLQFPSPAPQGEDPKVSSILPLVFSQEVWIFPNPTSPFPPPRAPLGLAELFTSSDDGSAPTFPPLGVNSCLGWQLLMRDWAGGPADAVGAPGLPSPLKSQGLCHTRRGMGSWEHTQMDRACKKFILSCVCPWCLI